MNPDNPLKILLWKRKCASDSLKHLYAKQEVTLAIYNQPLGRLSLMSEFMSSSRLRTKTYKIQRVRLDFYLLYKQLERKQFIGVWNTDAVVGESF